MPLFSDEEVGGALNSWASRVGVTPEERAGVQREGFRQAGERERLREEARKKREEEATLSRPLTWIEKIAAEGKLRRLNPQGYTPGMTEDMTQREFQTIKAIDDPHVPAAGPKPVDEDLLFDQEFTKAQKSVNPKDDPAAGPKSYIWAVNTVAGSKKWAKKPGVQQARGVNNHLEAVKATRGLEAAYLEARKMKSDQEKYNSADPLAQRTVDAWASMGGEERWFNLGVLGGKLSGETKF